MTPISRTIREQVTNQIRDDVVAGTFSAGEPLREGELAERFGVSRGPIRDAFLQLSQEGLLAYQANRGVTVRQAPDANNRDFVVSLRQQIECYVVERGYSKPVNGSWASVEAALENLRTACGTGNVADVAKSDMAFHEAILVACDGEEFLPVWKWLCSQMLLAYTRLENYEAVYDEHRAIFEAAKSGKKQELVTAIKKEH